MMVKNDYLRMLIREADKRDLDASKILDQYTMYESEMLQERVNEGIKEGVSEKLLNAFFPSIEIIKEAYDKTLEWLNNVYKPQIKRTK